MEPNEVERLKAALIDAIEIIRELVVMPLSCKVLQDQIEVHWRHYIETDARMRRIMAALEG